MTNKDYSKPVGYECVPDDAGGFARSIPIYRPLPIPEPCVIDEVPELFTLEGFLVSDDINDRHSRRWSRAMAAAGVSAADVRYVAGLTP